MPLSIAAVVVSALAIPAMLYVPDERFVAHAGYAFAMAAIWFVVALIHGAPALAGAAQAIGTIGVIYGVMGHCRTQDWWSGSFIEPWHLNWQLSALAVWSGLWIAARRAIRPFPAVARVLQSEPVSVDRVVLGAVVAGFAATCALAIAPGIFAEEVLVGWNGANPAPLYVLVVAPFLIGALLTASRALVRGQWGQLALAFGLGIAAVVCFARVIVVPQGVLWPGFPSPYGQGWGAGAWVALGLIGLALIAAHWERPTIATLSGFALILATLPFLVACRWDNELATASALCWASAGTALAVALLWGLHEPVARSSQRLRWITVDSPAWQSVAYVRNALVASTGFSVLAVTVGKLVSLVGEGRATAGPLADSFFARLGPAASDAIPLAILAASFVIYAIAERDVLWGMSATFLAQSAFGLVASYAVVLGPQPAVRADFVRFVQEMGFSAAIAAVGWLAFAQLVPRLSKSPASEERSLRTAILAQLALAAIFAAILTAGATCGLWISPDPLLNSVKACGSPLGWSLLVLAAGVWCVWRRGGWPASALKPAVIFFAAAAPLAAASLAAWNGPDNWLSFHTAIAGWCGLIGVATFGVLAATGRGGGRGELDLEPNRESTGGPKLPAAAPGGRLLAVADWTLWLTPLVVAFAVRGLLDDPLRPWWSAGATLWLSLCTLILAASAASRRRAYLSLLFAVLGSVFIGLKPWLAAGPQPIDQDVLDAVHITLIGAAVHALVWAAIEILQQRRRQTLDRPAVVPPPHHVVALLGTVVAGVPALAVMAQRLLQVAPESALPIMPASVLGWSSLALLALLCSASWWERGTRHGLPLLYALGLIALATYFGRLDLSHHEFVVAGACSLAGYVVVTGGAWALRRPLRAIGLRLGAALDDGEGQNIHRWLSSANLVVGVLVIAIGFWAVLTFPEQTLRTAAALATLDLAFGLALLATGPRQKAMQTDALAVGAMAAAQYGWALMDVGPMPHEELRRTIRLLVTLAATAFVYGVPLVRLVPAAGSWFVSIRRVAVGVAGAAVVTLGLILIFEILSFDPTGGVPVTVAESVVVAVALAGLAAGLISLAVLPGRDPFLTTEKQRFLYVYASEAVAGLLFAHLYLTNPELFRHLLQPYWPLVVMGLAFGGAGLSELFGRLKVNVLAKPVEYTAAFLPVLPVIGFWLLSSDLSYSTTLAAGGVLYLFLSLRRGSFVYSAAAAIVGNATLCTLFAEHGVSLLVHPQMFIIPPCVTVLAAAQLNRDRLGETALASVRYFAITLIYVSSTGEMFQHGIGTTLWLPMVLAGLSVLGVLTGIMIRVRAFLYLGTSFLLLSVVSMVWHASRSLDHVWPWCAFLFILSLALLTLFGIFEKKRAEVLLLIDRLRQWEK
ncbi:MAG TPA: hypothetical protein VMR25_07805 [Planctomycetaceae bacterium]|nr:hypothetical protein [Planctomycetaceae bacterium]